LLSIYVFARLVDDIGDEATGNRMTLLDKVSGELDRIYAGRAPQLVILSGLAVTIRARSIPRQPLDKLIEANRQDQHVHRYPTYADLLDYCVLSANPVGHLVLHVFGRVTRQRLAWSDKVCTALQILEHCQDVVEDLDRGRVYLPQEDLRLFGLEESDLKSPPANNAVRALLAFQTQRALRMLDEGAPLVGSVHGAARLAIGGYVAGGLATAAAITDAKFDVLSCTPRPRKVVVARHWARLLFTGGRV